MLIPYEHILYIEGFEEDTIYFFCINMFYFISVGNRRPILGLYSNVFEYITQNYNNS